MHLWACKRLERLMHAPGSPGCSMHVAVCGLCYLTPTGGAIGSLAHQGSSFLAWRRGPFCWVPLPGAGPMLGLFPCPLWLQPHCTASRGWNPGTCKCQPLLFATPSSPRRFLPRPFTLNPFILVSLTPSLSFCPSSFQPSLHSPFSL